ncbi:hypothetical protein pEaSNUABM37_00216 [Erwinia phage pEa_SNUABM_37]|nr:hypothetical protein pEaSNUABM37_00216 [Erwinia phage pEa_SNUABM_37]QXO10686.1 hypothetical protein pEaSNUABM48_00216 [Erwinia phage pEa_SNUABM_48]
MADGFHQPYLSKQQVRTVQKAMRTPNPTMRKAMLRSVKKR